MCLKKSGFISYVSFLGLVNLAVSRCYLLGGNEPFDVWNVLGLSEESSRVPCLVGKRRKELVSNLHIIWEGVFCFRVTEDLLYWLESWFVATLDSSISTSLGG